MKPCEFCKESIKADAKKCPYCLSNQPENHWTKQGALEDLKRLGPNLLPQSPSEGLLLFVLVCALIFGYVKFPSPEIRSFIVFFGFLVFFGRLWKITPANVLTLTSIMVASSGVYMQANNYKEQFQQFAILHRARLFYTVEGDATRGNILLINRGDLPAKDVSFAWKIIKISSEGKVEEFPTQNGINLFQRESLDVDGVLRIQYSANVGLNDETVLLIVYGKYFGKGIKENKEISDHLLWNVKSEPHTWASPNPLDPKHLDAADLAKEGLSKELAVKKMIFLIKG